MATTLVHSGDNLQAAINAASLGDTLVLDAGATFTGNFTLPAKAGSSYLTITTSGTLPGDTTRISPSDSAELPKLKASVGGLPALATEPSAVHYKLVGIEFLFNPSGFGDIISLGDGSNAQNNLSLVPDDLILDRCYIHGDPTVGQKRGISLHSSNTTIKNCYISDIKLAGQDTQAIAGWNGPGPYTINNNYLEGAGENLLFGGADSSITNLIPSDITITNNAFYKPPVWKGEAWQVKNLLELKCAQRVTIDLNTFDYCWAQAQVGIPIVFTVRNQSGGNNWNTIKDVTFTRNYVRHCGGGVNILGLDDGGNPSVEMTNVTIENNEFSDISQGTWDGEARFLQINGGDAITVNHNTCINSNSNHVTVYLINNPTTNFVFTNNIILDLGLAIFDTNGDAPGTGSLAWGAPGSVVSKNVIVGAPSSYYPVNNFFPATVDDVGFVDYAGGQYRLTSGSAYHNAALDGFDVGALFTGAVASAPSAPSSPNPADGATLVSRTPTLSWSASGATTYDVRFGTTNTPPTVVTAGASASYQPATLLSTTTYYWQIVANNDVGTTDGPVWSFTTIGGTTGGGGGGGTGGGSGDPTGGHGHGKKRQWRLAELLLKFRAEEQS